MALEMAPRTKERALTDHSEHICTPEDCPADGRYYVSCIDDNGNVFLMAGPYRSHGMALADVNKACIIASDIDGRAWFMAWGTVHHKGDLQPGRLNKFGRL